MLFFFFNDTATTEIYTLSLHDALPILRWCSTAPLGSYSWRYISRSSANSSWFSQGGRSEEHTSELQSRQYLVCRLLLEKKKNTHCYYSSPLHLDCNDNNSTTHRSSTDE